jgi:hypothetical protein
MFIDNWNILPMFNFLFTCMYIIMKLKK